MASLMMQLDFGVCQDLTLQRFVASMKEEHAKCPNTNAKEKQWHIQCGNHVFVEDFED